MKTPIFLIRLWCYLHGYKPDLLALRLKVKCKALAEISTLEADLRQVEAGKSPEQPRTEAEKSRLYQAIAALRRVVDSASG